MKKTYFFAFMLAVIFASCSSDNFLDSTDDGNSPIESKSAADKIFTATPINIPFYISTYSRNYLSVDSIGNVYTFTGDYNNKSIVMKYDILEDKTIEYKSVSFKDATYSDMTFGTICADKNQHVYLSNGKELVKIYNDGKSTANLTSRIAGHFDNLILNMCASYNGDILIGYDGIYKSGVIKLALNGKVIKINEWDWNTWENNPNTKGAGIFKPKGSFLYLQEHAYNYRKSNYKIGIQAGAVPEKLDSSIEQQAMTSSINNANIYVLRGYDIFRLRPNQSTDLLVGTIPESTLTTDGESIEIQQATDLWVNADASVFYINVYVDNVERICKLTLD